MCAVRSIKYMSIHCTANVRVLNVCSRFLRVNTDVVLRGTGTLLRSLVYNRNGRHVLHHRVQLEGVHCTREHFTYMPGM